MATTSGTLIFWPIRQATGGLSTGSRVGLPNSYQNGAFIDFKTDPNTMGVLPQAQLDSTNTITDLVNWFVTNGNYTYGLGNTGKIYHRLLVCNYTNIHTAASRGNGLGIFGANTYYAQDTQIGRFATGSTSFTDNWKTGLENDQFHPIKNFLLNMFIGNGRYLASWDDAVWNPQILFFQPNERVRCLEVWGGYLAIGTQFETAGAIPTGNVYLWDGTSNNTFASIIPFSGSLNALVNDNGTLTAFVGGQSDMYGFTSANGGLPSKIRQFPMIGFNSLDILPGAVGMWNNQVRLGVSSGTSETLSKGIWTYGSQDKNYPKVLSYDYALSNGKSSGSNIVIGSFLALSSSEAIYSWFDGTNYGIDRLNNQQLATEAIYESLVFDNGKPFLQRRFMQCRVTLNDPLQPSEYVKIFLRPEETNYWTLIGQTSEIENRNHASLTFDCAYDAYNRDIFDNRGQEHECRFVWGGTGDTRPNISSVTFTVEEDIDLVPTDFN